MELHCINSEKPWVTPETNSKSQYLYGLQPFWGGRQAGDIPETTGDRLKKHRSFLSPVSPVIKVTGDSYRPRFYWLSPVSPVSPSKTTGPTPCFAPSKTTSHPYSLDFVLFLPTKNVQKEVFL